MNLTTTPWIPVVTHDGTKSLAGLTDIFEHGHDFKDLAVNPPQRIALMRLLICIAQAALDGPENEKEWYACKDRLGDSGKAYLEEWQDRFDLYGALPFMQVPDLSVKEGKEDTAVKPLGTLDFRSPFGGSATPFFDRASIMPEPSIPDEEVALNLMTLINFSASGIVGQSQWGKAQFDQPILAAPCIKALHTFIIGESLLESIHWNLLCKKGFLCGVENLPNSQWGRPVWELFPKTPEDESALENATKTYLGRLVPFSRLVNLTTFPGKCIVGPVPPQFEIQRLPLFREPSTTVALDKNEKPYYFAVSSEKHIWRDLGSILAQGMHAADRQGAVALRRIYHYAADFQDKTVEIWSGGLETGASAAKLSDMVSWNVTVPLEMFENDSSEFLMYEQGIALAQSGEFRLKEAVKKWCEDMSIPPKQLKKLSYFIRAQTHYWSLLDTRYRVLMNAVIEEKPLADQWYGVVRKSMEKAYSHACPHTTPRQIRAFAMGRRQLWLKNPENQDSINPNS